LEINSDFIRAARCAVGKSVRRRFRGTDTQSAECGEFLYVITITASELKDFALLNYQRGMCVCARARKMQKGFLLRPLPRKAQHNQPSFFISVKCLRPIFDLDNVLLAADAHVQPATSADCSIKGCAPPRGRKVI